MARKSRRRRYKDMNEEEWKDWGEKFGKRMAKRGKDFRRSLRWDWRVLQHRPNNCKTTVDTVHICLWSGNTVLSNSLADSAEKSKAKMVNFSLFPIKFSYLQYQPAGFPVLSVSAPYLPASFFFSLHIF